MCTGPPIRVYLHDMLNLIMEMRYMMVLMLCEGGILGFSLLLIGNLSKSMDIDGNLWGFVFYHKARRFISTRAEQDLRVSE